MKRWTAIDSDIEVRRWEQLSSALNARGAVNEFMPWQGSSDSLEIAQLDGYDHVRLNASLGSSLLSQVHIQSTWATLIGVVDGMSRVNGGWWPLCALYEAMGQLFIHIGQRLDMRGSVMLAGAGGMARVAIAAFFRAGFKNFLVANIDQVEAEQLIREVQGKLFGLSIEYVPMEKIVLLPGDSTVIVNCNASADDGPLVNELSYLNFLRRPGFLFDTSLQSKRNLLAQEAADSGVQLVKGIEIAARADVLWAKWAFGVELDLAQYQEQMSHWLNESAATKS